MSQEELLEWSVAVLLFGEVDAFAFGVSQEGSDRMISLARKSPQSVREVGVTGLAIAIECFLTHVP
jgi:hypothetical protein